VAGAPELLAGEPVEVPFGGVAQRLDSKCLGRPLAGRPAVVVARVGEAALDAGVADHQGEARAFEVQGDGLGLQRAAVDEQGGAGLAQQRGVLVHDAALDPDVPVLGALADPGQRLLVQAEPEERVEGEGRRGLDGRRGGEPRGAGHVAGEGRPEAARLVAGLPQRPEDGARVLRPGVVLAAKRPGLVEVGGVERLVAVPGGGDRYAAVDGAGRTKPPL
jgi:hypothetical protein